MRTTRLLMHGAVGCGAAILCLMMVADAAAQSQSLFGNRGPNGQRNQRLGGATGATGGLGAGGFGTGGVGGGLGRTGTGLGTGMQGLGGAGVGQQAGLEQVQGFTGGFVGRSDNVGRFVGQQQGGGAQATPLGGANRLGGALRQRTNAGGFNDPNNPVGGGFGGSQARRQAYIVRPQQRIAFEYPARTTAEIGTSVRTQMTQIAGRRESLRGVRVETGANGLVTLRGQVETEDARKLAAVMARLEPGVREVRNELTIPGEAAAR